MKYVSTRDNSKEFSFEDVFIKGLADDGGLYHDAWVTVNVSQ